MKNKPGRPLEHKNSVLKVYMHEDRKTRYDAAKEDMEARFGINPGGVTWLDFFECKVFGLKPKRHGEILRNQWPIGCRVNQPMCGDGVVVSTKWRGKLSSVEVQFKSGLPKRFCVNVGSTLTRLGCSEGVQR